MSREVSLRSVACRSQAARQLALLPLDAPTVGFDIGGNRAPTLPPRDTPLRACSACVAAFACGVFALAVVCIATEPASIGGNRLAQNVRNVVGEAIAHANDAAEERRRMQEDARRDYIARRSPPTAAPTRSARRVAPSNLLLRLAAIRKDKTTELDMELMRQFFPRWRTDGGWNKDEVLNDLVIAVSHLAHRAELQETE